MRPPVARSYLARRIAKFARGVPGPLFWRVDPPLLAPFSRRGRSPTMGSVLARSEIECRFAHPLGSVPPCAQSVEALAGRSEVPNVPAAAVDEPGQVFRARHDVMIAP